MKQQGSGAAGDRFLYPFNKKTVLLDGFLMAEREGFEPSVRVTAHPRSRRAPSTTQTSLRVRQLL